RVDGDQRVAGAGVSHLAEATRAMGMDQLRTFAQTWDFQVVIKSDSLGRQGRGSSSIPLAWRALGPNAYAISVQTKAGCEAKQANSAARPLQDVAKVSIAGKSRGMWRTHNAIAHRKVADAQRLEQASKRGTGCVGHFCVSSLCAAHRLSMGDRKSYLN